MLDFYTISGLLTTLLRFHFNGLSKRKQIASTVTIITENRVTVSRNRVTVSSVKTAKASPVISVASLAGHAIVKDKDEVHGQCCM